MRLNKFFEEYLRDEFHGNEIEYEGLFLEFNYNKNTGEMEWSIDNPNDVSYLRNVISSFIDEWVSYFLNAAGSSDYHGEMRRKQSLVNMIRKGTYINDNDFRKFLDLAQNPKIYQYYDVLAKLNVFDIDFENDGGQGLGINIHMKLINPIDSRTRNKLTYNEVGKRLAGLNNDDDFLEYIDGLFNDLASEIYNNRPTIFDRNNMYISIFPYFYTDEGKQMKHWY